MRAQRRRHSIRARRDCTSTTSDLLNVRLLSAWVANGVAKPVVVPIRPTPAAVNSARTTLRMESLFFANLVRQANHLAHWQHPTLPMARSRSPSSHAGLRWTAKLPDQRQRPPGSPAHHLKNNRPGARKNEPRLAWSYPSGAFFLCRFRFERARDDPRRLASFHSRRDRAERQRRYHFGSMIGELHVPQPLSGGAQRSLLHFMDAVRLRRSGVPSNRTTANLTVAFDLAD